MNDTSESDYMDRVQRGIALLNEKRPGWLDDIDLDDLDLADTTDCILGQLYGDFMDGCVELGLRRIERQVGCYCCADDSISHGFFLPGDKVDGYCELAEAWTQAIAALRNERVQKLTGYGWFLSRDGKTLISPRTGGITPVDDETKLEHPADYAPGIEFNLRASF